MALTRKMLKAMGIEDEKIDQIIEEHAETVNALKQQRDQYKVDAEKLPGVQKELDELKDAAEKDGENPYKAKYEDLQQQFDDYKADVIAKETKARKTAAYRKLLQDSKISEKRLDAILKLSPVDDIELDDKGEIKDAENIKKSIEKEWSDFIVTEETHGAGVQNPPAGGNPAGASGGGTKSRAAQIQQQYQASLYGSKEAK
jgi:hypothetical protein